MLSYFPVFFVVTGRFIDKGMIGIYIKRLFWHFNFSFVQYMLDVKSHCICKYPKIDIWLYFTIYIFFNDEIATDAEQLYRLCDVTTLSEELQAHVLFENWLCFYSPHIEKFYKMAISITWCCMQLRSPMSTLRYTSFSFH